MISLLEATIVLGAVIYACYLLLSSVFCKPNKCINNQCKCNCYEQNVS